jgi:hypothetical protein
MPSEIVREAVLARLEADGVRVGQFAEEVLT